MRRRRGQRCVCGGGRGVVWRRCGVVWRRCGVAAVWRRCGVEALTRRAALFPCVQEIMARRKAKAAQLQSTIRQRKKELALKREEAWLRQQDKIENVERIKRQKEFELGKVRQKLQAKEEKLRSMKEMQEALLAERAAERKQAIIDRHHREATTIPERNVLPGPGEYNVPSTMDGSNGFRMSKFTPKSDLDWVIHRAKQMPGPGQYQDIEYKVKAPAASFGKGVVPSDLEWKMIRASEMPGPSAYGSAQFKPETPSFSMGNFKPKSDLELKILRAAELPGPGAYDVGTSVPKRARSVRELHKAIMSGEMDDLGFGFSDSTASPSRSRLPRNSSRGSLGSRTPTRSPMRTGLALGNSAGKSRRGSGSDDVAPTDGRGSGGGGAANSPAMAAAELGDVQEAPDSPSPRKEEAEPPSHAGE